MHPEFSQALARQRIEEIHEFARAPRVRSGFWMRIRWASLLGGRRVAQGRPFGGQFESEAR